MKMSMTSDMMDASASGTLAMRWGMIAKDTVDNMAKSLSVTEQACTSLYQRILWPRYCTDGTVKDCGLYHLKLQ